VHVGDVWLVDGAADLGEETHAQVADTVDITDDLLGDLRREQVVDLPDVVDRVLPAGRFHRHRAVGCDESVRAIAPAHGAVVALLGRGAGDGEVDRALLVVVGRIDVDVDRAVRVLARDTVDELPD